MEKFLYRLCGLCVDPIIAQSRRGLRYMFLKLIEHVCTVHILIVTVKKDDKITQLGIICNVFLIEFYE